MSKAFSLSATVSACLIGTAMFLQCSAAFAQSPASKSDPAPAANAPAVNKAAVKPAVKPKKSPAKPVAAPEAPLPAASAEQIEAAERIYYGVSACELKQSIDVSINSKYPAYVDVKFEKKIYTMKPVLSPTGAMRLEDVKNQAILIQIAQKSMLLNTVSGQRLVDECVSPKQRELMELQKQAAAAEAQAAAATAAASAAQTK